MNSKILGAVSIALAGFVSAHAAGFALYGASAKGMSLGGATMGRAIDASVNFYNPSALTDFTNTVVTVGCGFEVPRANVHVRMASGNYSGVMNPGCFYLPHAYVAQPLPFDFAFGLGIAPEFGLGSEYNGAWPMNWNTKSTVVEGLVVNPNLAYKVTEDWSVAAGIRIIDLTFEQYSKPLAAQNGVRFGQMSTHIKGDNGFADWGWQVSTKYKILDNLTASLIYRSYIDTRVRGKYHTRVESYDYIAVAQQQIRDKVDAGAEAAHGDGAANIRLPQSICFGLDWDATETVHFGYGMTWTHWSSVDKIHFNLSGGDKTVPLQWDDVFRFAFGSSWDFAENWSLMGSYVYDIDPCSTKKNVGSTMLPPGDRHLLTGGLAWHYANWEISACYGLILLSGRDQKFEDELGREYKFSTTAGRSHQFAVTLSYYF